MPHAKQRQSSKKKLFIYQTFFPHFIPHSCFIAFQFTVRELYKLWERETIELDIEKKPKKIIVYLSHVLKTYDDNYSQGQMRHN